MREVSERVVQKGKGRMPTLTKTCLQRGGLGGEVFLVLLCCCAGLGAKQLGERGVAGVGGNSIKEITNTCEEMRFKREEN